MGLDRPACPHDALLCDASAQHVALPQTYRACAQTELVCAEPYVPSPACIIAHTLLSHVSAGSASLHGRPQSVGGLGPALRGPDRRLRGAAGGAWGTALARARGRHRALCGHDQLDLLRGHCALPARPARLGCAFSKGNSATKTSSTSCTPWVRDAPDEQRFKVQGQDGRAWGDSGVQVADQEVSGVVHGLTVGACLQTWLRSSVRGADWL